MVSREFGLKSLKAVDGADQSLTKRSKDFRQTGLAVRSASTAIRLKQREVSRSETVLSQHCA